MSRNYPAFLLLARAWWPACSRQADESEDSTYLSRSDTFNWRPYQGADFLPFYPVADTDLPVLFPAQAQADKTNVSIVNGKTSGNVDPANRAY